MSEPLSSVTSSSRAARWPQRPFRGRIYGSDMVADRFRSRLLRFRSALSHRGRAFRYRPVLRTQRPLLLPHHRPERTLGLMGLRIHRSSSLPLPLTLLNPKAPATIALQLAQLSRSEQVIAQYGALSTDGGILSLSGGVFPNIHYGMIVPGPLE